MTFSVNQRQSIFCIRRANATCQEKWVGVTNWEFLSIPPGCWMSHHILCHPHQPWKALSANPQRIKQIGCLIKYATEWAIEFYCLFWQVKDRRDNFLGFYLRCIFNVSSTKSVPGCINFYKIFFPNPTLHRMSWLMKTSLKSVMLPLSPHWEPTRKVGIRLWGKI